MTFFFDARFIRVTHHDGISRFAANLCTELSKLRDVTAIISDLGQLRVLPDGIKYVLECAPTSIHEIGLARRLNKLGATLVYSPMQTTGSLGRKFRLVLTLHDLIYYRHRKPPREFNALVRALWRLYHWSYLPGRLMLSAADGLVTISKTSRSLIQRHKLFSGPIEIVYNAPEDAALGYQPRSRPLSKRLIYMGSFMPYKDVDTLVAGMQELPDYTLELLSKVHPEEKQRLQKLAGSAAGRLIFRGGVSDEEYLASLLSATALVTASRDEGFGIPLVEAMRVGTPVVCSDLEIFREVAGGAAIYFETGQPQSFATQVKALELDWEGRSKLAIKKAAEYSWRDSAKVLDNFLKKFD